MNKFILAASAVAIVIGVPAIAQMASPGPRPAETRGGAEANVRSHFAMIDANHDGFVTREEAARARDQVRSAMRDKRFAMLDTDRNGAISRAEFDAQGPGNRPHGDVRRGGRGARGMMGGRMFDRADADKDGRVSEKEAITLAMTWFDRADANRDGTVTPDERRAVRDAMRAQWKDRQAR